MKHFLRLAILLTTLLGTVMGAATAKAASTPTPAGPAHYHIENLMPAFWDFWSKAKQLDVDAQAALFEKQVAARYPNVYAPQVLGLDPGQAYSSALAGRYKLVHRLIGARMDLVRNLSDSIERDLPQYEKRFREVFPDFAYDGDIVFMYSLGGFDGGTRNVGGKVTLLFGLDMIAYVYGKDADLAPFFHHELFHVYHSQLLGAAPTDDSLISALWREGLATYVAQVLNPQSGSISIFGLPRSTPDRVRADLPQLARQLRSKLDSTSESDYRVWFNGSQENAVPPARAGYFIGFLVAERLGRKHTPQELAHMPVHVLRPEIEAVLRDLAETR